MNVHAEIGHNNPPEQTEFEKIKQEIEDLYRKAKKWLDGKPVETQADADAISKLLDDIKIASKKAEEERKVEVKPFDDGKAEIQARYNELIGSTKTVTGKAILAANTCKEALSPFLIKKEEARKAQEAEARAQAEAARAAAQEALRQSQPTDLEEREAAEVLLKKAQQAEKSAAKVAKTRTNVKGGSRAVGLTTIKTPVLTDANAAAAHYWLERRTEMEELFLTLAKQDVRAGKSEIPGFEIQITQEAR